MDAGTVLQRHGSEKSSPIRRPQHISQMVSGRKLGDYLENLKGEDCDGSMCDVTEQQGSWSGVSH